MTNLDLLETSYHATTLSWFQLDYSHTTAHIQDEHRYSFDREETPQRQSQTCSPDIYSQGSMVMQIMHFPFPSHCLIRPKLWKQMSASFLPHERGRLSSPVMTDTHKPSFPPIQQLKIKVRIQHLRTWSFNNRAQLQMA